MPVDWYGCSAEAGREISTRYQQITGMNSQTTGMNFLLPAVTSGMKNLNKFHWQNYRKSNSGKFSFMHQLVFYNLNHANWISEKIGYNDLFSI